jgi:hypothetical protein
MVGLLILMACTGTKPSTQPAKDTCQAAAMQELVGQSAQVLHTMRFGQTVRFLRPDTPMTKDYRPDRLNIWINSNEKISRITCG